MKFSLKEGIRDCTSILCSLDKPEDSPELALLIFRILPNNQSNTIVIPTDERYLNESFCCTLVENNISRLITIGKRRTLHRMVEGFQWQHYDSKEAFIDAYRKQDYTSENIMLYDAADLKQLCYLFEKKTRQTILEVNLDAMAHNVRYFQSKLKPGVQLAALVKAFSYGTSAYEVACLMQHLGVSYLGVAAADEGILLRELGITMPILVLTPETEHLDTMVKYQLEPELHNFRSLNAFIDAANRLNLHGYPIHIKIDTGMHRQGFEKRDIDSLIELLQKNPSVKVVSAFTHLAASDEERHDDFTREQLSTFDIISTQLKNKLGYDFIRHALNSAGIERFSEGQFDMVRLGIGMYGASDVSKQDTQVVSTFRSVVTQIKDLAATETVGYGRKGELTKPTRIAVMPVGYADGLSRRLGNGRAMFLVNGQLAPTIGNVCMDLSMLDITGLDVKEGDEVILFGENPSVFDIANKLGTISYEVLTGIAARVKRVYVMTDELLKAK